MKVHLKQIPPEGLHLEGEEECAIAELEAEGIHCTGPMHYSLDLGVSSGALWANGSLSQVVEVRCVVCLQKFEHEVKVPAFALHTELHGPETVDLTPFMREDILLNLPPYPRCDRDGDRACQGPAIKETGTAGETEKKREHDWGALDKLKIRKS